MANGRTILVFVSLAIAAGCGPRIVLTPVYESENVRVVLRHTLEGGEPLDRGYQHPVVISDVRLVHILASISHETRSGERKPTIRSGHVYELAEGLNKALSRAETSDAAIASAIWTDRRFGIFSDRRVTAFRAFFEGDQLVLEFYAIEADVERALDADGRRREFQVPLELPDTKPAFRLIAGKAQATLGARSLEIDWRNPEFAKPVGISVRQGQIRRRTILLESDPDEPNPPAARSPVSGKLHDAQMRALDQLDAARRAGLINEREFRRRQRLVLEGQLEDAGYAPEAP